MVSFTHTDREYKKTCADCGKSFVANAPRATYCETCKPLARQRTRLEAQKRYERTTKSRETKHKYNTGTRRVRESGQVTSEQAADSSGARFSR